LVTVFSGQIYAFATDTGEQLIASTRYIEAVLSEEGLP
jgi:hypothetical protein